MWWSPASQRYERPRSPRASGEGWSAAAAGVAVEQDAGGRGRDADQAGPLEEAAPSELLGGQLGVRYREVHLGTRREVQRGVVVLVVAVAVRVLESAVGMPMHGVASVAMRAGGDRPARVRPWSIQGAGGERPGRSRRTPDQRCAGGTVARFAAGCPRTGRPDLA